MDRKPSLIEFMPNRFELVTEEKKRSEFPFFALGVSIVALLLVIARSL